MRRYGGKSQDQKRQDIFVFFVMSHFEKFKVKWRGLVLKQKEKRWKYKNYINTKCTRAVHQRRKKHTRNQCRLQTRVHNLNEEPKAPKRLNPFSTQSSSSVVVAKPWQPPTDLQNRYTFKFFIYIHIHRDRE